MLNLGKGDKVFCVASVSFPFTSYRYGSFQVGTLYEVIDVNQRENWVRIIDDNGEVSLLQLISDSELSADKFFIDIKEHRDKSIDYILNGWC